MCGRAVSRVQTAELEPSRPSRPPERQVAIRATFLMPFNDCLFSCPQLKSERDRATGIFGKMLVCPPSPGGAGGPGNRAGRLGAFQLSAAVVPSLLPPVTPRHTHSGFHSAHGDPVSVAPRGRLLSASQVGWGGTHRCDDSARGAGRNSVPRVRRARSSSVLLQATLSSQRRPQDTYPSRGASHCGSKPREERDSKQGAAVLLVIAWSWHTPHAVLRARPAHPTQRRLTGRDLREAGSGPPAVCPHGCPAICP